MIKRVVEETPEDRNEHLRPANCTCGYMKRESGAVDRFEGIVPCPIHAGGLFATRDPKAEQVAIDAGQVDEPGAMYRYDVSWQRGLMR